MAAIPSKLMAADKDYVLSSDDYHHVVSRELPLEGGSRLLCVYDKRKEVKKRLPRRFAFTERLVVLRLKKPYPSRQANE